MHNRAQKFVHNIYQGKFCSHVSILSPACRLPLQKAVMELRRLSALFRYFVSHRERGSSLTDCLILRRRAKMQVTADGDVCVRLFTILENVPFSLSLSLFLFLSL